MEVHIKIALGFENDTLSDGEKFVRLIFNLIFEPEIALQICHLKNYSNIDLIVIYD